MGILKAGSLSIFDKEFNLKKKFANKFGDAKKAFNAQYIFSWKHYY